MMKIRKNTMHKECDARSDPQLPRGYPKKECANRRISAEATRAKADAGTNHACRHKAHGIAR